MIVQWGWCIHSYSWSCGSFVWPSPWGCKWGKIFLQQVMSMYRGASNFMSSLYLYVSHMTLRWVVLCLPVMLLHGYRLCWRCSVRLEALKIFQSSLRVWRTGKHFLILIVVTSEDLSCTFLTIWISLYFRPFRKRKMSGFGHRVYKNYDPRAKVIKKLADEVFSIVGRDPLIEVRFSLLLKMITWSSWCFQEVHSII